MMTRSGRVWVFVTELLLVAAGVACSSEDAGQPAGSAGTAGTAGAAGAAGVAGASDGGLDGAPGDSAPEGSPEAEAGSDDSGEEGGTHPGPGETCDPLTQDCTDPTAPKCQFDVTDANNPTAICGELLGTDQLGEECGRPTNEVGVDTCDKGLFCSNIGMPTSSPQMRSCRKVCNKSSQCETNEACAVVNTIPIPGGEPLLGYCAPGCDLYDASTCPALSKCLWAATAENVYAYFCWPAGTKTKGESCSSNPECEGALGCVTAPSLLGPDQGTCQPWCDENHNNCEGTQTCHLFVTGLGICATLSDT